MNIRHLQIFVTVAELGKMHAAAQKLHISQPSVSQAVKELEQFYGILLFDRLSGRIYLTEEGKKFLPYARHIVESYDAMEDYALQAAKSDTIRIGGSVSVGTMLLPGLVQHLRKEIEGIDIKVTVDNTAFIEKMVKNSEVDIAIVEGMIEDKELEQRDIYEDELVLVVGKKHPFYKRKQILLSELEQEPLISRETGSAERNQFEHYLLSKNIRMKNEWSCSNTETIKQAVIAGEGVAILSEMLVQEEVKKDIFKIVSVEDVRIKRNIKMIYYKNKYFSRSMKKLCELCMDKKNFLLE